MAVKEVTFDLNKYGEPDLLDVKKSVAQQIVNALFMVPGNLPSLPNVGCNIRQYLYKSFEVDYISSNIERGLQGACGTIISGAVINGVDVSIQKTLKGEEVFLVITRITFQREENESILGVSVAKDINQKVKFNFAYVDV